MSTLPHNLAQNSAVWAILDPVLDTPVGVRDRSGTIVSPPAPERKTEAQRLLQYFVDQRILFAMAMNVMKSKSDRYSRDDLQVALSMCALRISDFVQFSVTREMITADVIDDTVRPTIGLITQMAVSGAAKDLDREYRDQLVGTSTRWRRHRYAVQWQDELRGRLGYEPSLAELNEYFAECSANLSRDPVRNAMFVTTDDLAMPPRAVSLDQSEYFDDDESIADTLADTDQDAAEARIDCAVAVGLIWRAIRMWAPDDEEAQESMRRYVAAWITVRSEPGAPDVVPVHQTVKLSGLSKRVATRMAAAFDEHALPYVRENIAPAQAQAHVQRLELIDVIEGAIRAWAPEDPERQAQMRVFTSAWFRARRLQLPLTVKNLARRLSWTWESTREFMAEFEEHIRPSIDAAVDERQRRTADEALLSQ